MSADMAPWQELPYFNPPVETIENVASATTTLLCSYDPTRVILVFSTPQNSSVCLISTKTPITSSTGMTVLASGGPLILTAKEHGPLPTYQYYGQAGSGTQVNVLQVSLNRWPSSQSKGPNIRTLQAAIERLSQRIGKLVNSDVIKPSRINDLIARLVPRQ